MLRSSFLLVATAFLYLAAPASLAKQDTAPSCTFNVMSISLSGRNWAYTPSADPSHHEEDSHIVYIGVRLSDFDYGVINVQEDHSLGFHNTLYRYDRHPFHTKFSTDFWFDPGLSTISKYSWLDFACLEWHGRVTATETREAWDLASCGSITIRRAPGDKRWKIQQLADFIDANSVGNAVIIFGNTNSLYTSPEDNIRILTIQNGLTDAWVQAIGGNTPAVGANQMVCPPGIPSNISCEGVDKIFYRGSPIINLTSSGFFYDTSRFLSPEGIPLADRNPVRVEFEYTLKPGLRQSDLGGGPHGTWFNDLHLIPSSPALSSITLRGGNRLDGLTLILTSGQAFVHGGWGGNPYWLTLASGEYITVVKLCWGKRNGHTRIFYARAITNIGGSVQAGKVTENCTNATAPSGYGVVGTYGRAGDEIDQLGFIYGEQSPQVTPAAGGVYATKVSER
ncbi:endonuclease/exonuclease/phosphatase family protein, putative, partial [Rhizoctonia solani AG-3 Rhs1AP]